MSISGIGLSSQSSANGPTTSLQANFSSSPSASLSSQNETVYHVRTSSTSTSARSGGTNQQSSGTAAAVSGNGKRVIFMRLTDAAIQQFEKLALDCYGHGSKKTHATPASQPTISCFRRKTTNGVEKSEGEISIPSSSSRAPDAVAGAATKLSFSITSANNCDNPRSSFECIKLRRAVKTRAGAGSTGEGTHLGFFRHQFQVRASEAESFSSTKRKLQEVKLQDTITKGLTSLPEQTGRRTAVSVVPNSQSSSNLSLLSKKVKSHNQAGTIKPVSSASRLVPPMSTYSARKSPGNALSPLVLGSSPSSTGARPHQHAKQVSSSHASTTNTKALHQQHSSSTNNSPVIQKTSSPATLTSSAAAAKPAAPLVSTKSALSQPQQSSTFSSSSSRENSQKPIAPVISAASKAIITSSGSPLPRAPSLSPPPPPPPQKHTNAVAPKVAATADKTSGAAAASNGKQLAPVPSEKALATDKSASPAAGIALLRNSAPQIRDNVIPPISIAAQRSVVDAGRSRSQPTNAAVVNDDSTSPKENFAISAGVAPASSNVGQKYSGAASSGAYSSGSSTGAVYGGGSSTEHDRLMLESIDSRPESAYSSGNESTSSTGVGSALHSAYNNLVQHPSTHIVNSSGPGSASSMTSTSSSSSANANDASDAAHYEKLLEWCRTIRECTTFSERQRLNELYIIDWQRYGDLRRYILSVRDRFDNMKAELDRARGHRAEFRRLSERIRYEYDAEMRRNNYKERREKYERLRAHLTRISRLIQLYDEKREIQVQNKLMSMNRNNNDVEMLSSGNVGGGGITTLQQQQQQWPQAVGRR